MSPKTSAPTAVLPIVLLTALSSACTWVELKPGAESVELRSAASVQDCERLGQTSTSVRERVGAFQRSPGKVEEELANLARNSAFELGGDTIVADGPVSDGEQHFVVYRCQR